MVRILSFGLHSFLRIRGTLLLIREKPLFAFRTFMKTENLAIVFIDIAGFTPRTSRQTREESVQMLRRFDYAVRPLVRAYEGRVVKTIGDAYLLTFRSPTNALLCSMAVHDRLAETDGEVDSFSRFAIRAAVNVGEVRIEGGDIFGEAVNIAARIEGEAGAGEIYFSESAFLSMTRTEIPSQEVGYAELKGIPGKVRLFRVPRSNEAGDGTLKELDRGGQPAVALPFGGLALNRVRNKLTFVSPARILDPAREHAQNLLLTLLNQLADAVSRAVAWWRMEVRRSRAVQIGTLIALALITWFLIWALKPKPATPWQKLHRTLGF